MRNALSVIRSAIFLIFVNSLGTLIPIIYFPVFLFNSRKLADHGGKTWARFSLYALKKLCNVDYKVLGLEKVPKDRPFIIACKHQSMWETVVMATIFKAPAYAYKKELLSVPFYGWFVKRMSGITVDRKGGASAIKNLVKETNHYLSKNQNIVIFPQGTRVPVSASVEDYPYQAGISALYTKCNAVVVPVALNSGVFWPKHTVKKYPGTITLEFLDPIEPGLKRPEFLEKMQSAIETNSERLAKNP